MLVYQGKYFDWYAYQSTWNSHNTQYLSQVNYPDQVYDQLVQILGVDIINKTTDHRLYLMVDQQTGGGFAANYISEIGKGPGIGIAYDAWYNIYSRSDVWSTELIAHEMTNVFTGQIVGGWPIDWWADDRSPFPYAIKIMVEQNLGHSDASDASLYSADALTRMFLQFMSTYGSDIYSQVLQAIESDGWSQWFGPNPSLLLSEYVAAYLSIGTGTNLADQINTNLQITGIPYQLDRDTVQNIWDYRQYLQQFPRDDPKWQLFRQGETVFKIETTLSCSVSSSTITIGDNVTVSGTISPTMSGKVVTLTYAKPDGATVTRTVTTGSDGSYSDPYKPNAVGSWSVVASWDGDSQHFGSTSQTASFNVKAVIDYTLYVCGISAVAVIILVGYMVTKRKRKPQLL